MDSTGRVIGICVSQKRSDPKENVGRGFIREKMGLVGDSHAGTEKEVSLLAMESVRELSRKTGIVTCPGCFAENITTEGVELKNLPVGAEIQVGKARLRILEVGKDPSAPHTYSFQGYSLLREEGVFCTVARSGRVKVGDAITVVRD